MTPRITLDDAETTPAPPARARSAPEPDRRPKKTAILLAQRIVRHIISQDLQPGEMLAPEHEMLADYRVGRATLREALRYLELQGVLTIKPGPRGGPMVTAPTSRALASIFALVLEMSRTPFSHVLDARLTLEPLLAAQAAMKIDDEQLADLQECHEAMLADLDRPERFLDHNHRFHELVAAGSGNRVFEYLLASLHSIADGTPMGVSYGMADRQAVAAAHGRILDALAAHDPVAADAAMESHIRAFCTYITKRYPETIDQHVNWGDHYT